MAKAKLARMREASSEGALGLVTRPGASDADGDGDNDASKGPCPTCGGDGINDGDVCPTCDGNGQVMSEAAEAEDEVTLCEVCLTPDCGVEGVTRIREATLTAKARKAIAPSNFAIPSKAPDSGSYPIHDLSHAQNALARSSGKPEEGTVKSAVYKKWPSLKPGAESTKEADNAADDKVQCPTCKGSGKMLGGNMTCKTCDGTGKVTAEKAAALKKSSGSKPPWLSETKATLVERIEALEDDAGIFRSLREAKPGVLSATYSTPTRVKTSDGREGYEVVLIREGLGNATDDNWYTADAIKEMCEAGVAEGMQAYANHPDLEEEQNRPERDVKQLVGSYADVQFMESGGVPRAKAVLVPMTTDEMHPTYGWVVTLAEAAANNTGPQPLAGISLYGLSAGDYGPRPDGSEGRMVTMIRPTSGDVVTNAGAGGEFVRKTLRESARRLRRANPTTKGRTRDEGRRVQQEVRGGDLPHA